MGVSPRFPRYFPQTPPRSTHIPRTSPTTKHYARETASVRPIFSSVTEGPLSCIFKCYNPRLQLVVSRLFGLKLSINLLECRSRDSPQIIFIEVVKVLNHLSKHKHIFPSDICIHTDGVFVNDFDDKSNLCV